jgi:hypothetical protein
MSLDPRLVEIPQSLLDLVGEELARSREILPYEDDGTHLTMFCPSHPTYGTFGESVADRIGKKIGRKVKWIPVDRDIMSQAVDERFSEINNCPVEFSFKCPKTWHSLQVTGEARIRHCSACQSSVYWCDLASEAKKLAKEGKCIAISGKDGANDLSIYLGIVATDKN